MDWNGIEQVKRHEGRRLKMYKCSAGKNTIGYGHNCDDTPISSAAAELILKDDLDDFISQIDARLEWVADLETPRKWVLYNMAFNMGVPGLEKFVKFLKAMKDGEWELAAKEMMDSKWAVQVGSRAEELRQQVLTGEWV